MVSQDWASIFRFLHYEANAAWLVGVVIVNCVIVVQTIGLVVIDTRLPIWQRVSRFGSVHGRVFGVVQTLLSSGQCQTT